MKCTECGAPLRLEPDKDYLICDYCTAMHFPEPNSDGVRVLGEKAAELCPVCKVELTHAAHSGMRLLWCERCRGMLVLMDVFLALMDALRPAPGRIVVRPPNPRELNRQLQCPHCHRAMNTHHYAGPGSIVIDSCSECHLNWLDYGELLRVLRAPGGE